MKDILSEFVYGSTDGIITTFSIIAGSIGGNLSEYVILILGLSNVLSDGYSMGVSRYLSAKTEIEQGILLNKDALKSAIATFLSFVIVGLLPLMPFINGLFKEVSETKKENSKEESSTEENIERTNKNKQSLVIALLVFFIIGVIKGYYLENKNILSTGLESLVIGGSAAYISYSIGKYINGLIED